MTIQDYLSSVLGGKYAPLAPLQKQKTFKREILNIRIHTWTAGYTGIPGAEMFVEFEDYLGEDSLGKITTVALPLPLDLAEGTVLSQAFASQIADAQTKLEALIPEHQLATEENAFLKEERVVVAAQVQKLTQEFRAQQERSKSLERELLKAKNVKESAEA